MSLTRRRSPRVAPNDTSHPDPLLKVDHENNVSASKASVIRIICGQIFQNLYDASDTLNEEMLQQLSIEIIKCSQDAIKRKLAKPSADNVNIKSNKKQSLPVESNRSLKNAINERMANVVEKEDYSRAPLRPVREQLSPKKYNGPLSLFNLITKLPDDEGQYDVFLNICDPNLMTNQQQLRRDYIAFKRSDSNVPFMLFCLLFGLFAVVEGLVWSNELKTYRDYPTAALSILFALLAAISFLMVILHRVALLSFRYNIVSLQCYHEYVTKLYDSSYGQWPDNSTIVCAALATGFYLINIVVMDLCDPNMVVNVGKNSHVSCNSFVEPPPESFVFTMTMILLLQIAARGVGRIALVCSWSICFVAINTSIYLSNSGSYLWMNLLQSLLVFVSYELERLPLRQYIKTTRAVEAGELNAKLKVRLAAYETLQAAEALKAKCSLVHYTSYPLTYPAIVIIIIIISPLFLPLHQVRHIGHEIRTPLNVVGVGVDMLLKELEPHAAVLPGNIMEIVVDIKVNIPSCSPLITRLSNNPYLLHYPFVNDFQEASSASLEVINELLMFEKLAAGMTTLECVPTPVLPFLEQTMRQHMMPARAKHILFELVPSAVARNVAIDVDPIKLITVFRNLFSNAIKFTKKQGQVTVRAEVKCQSLEGDEVVEVTVQDTGAGLSGMC